MTFNVQGTSQIFNPIFWVIFGLKWLIWDSMKQVFHPDVPEPALSDHLKKDLNDANHDLFVAKGKIEDQSFELDKLRAEERMLESRVDRLKVDVIKQSQYESNYPNGE